MWEFAYESSLECIVASYLRVIKVKSHFQGMGCFRIGHSLKNIILRMLDGMELYVVNVAVLR